jgi:hypothetical protein
MANGFRVTERIADPPAAVRSNFSDFWVTALDPVRWLSHYHGHQIQHGMTR